MVKLSKLDTGARLEAAADSLCVARDALEECRIETKVICNLVYEVEETLRELCNRIDEADCLTN